MDETFYKTDKKNITNLYHKIIRLKTKFELEKSPKRTEIINCLLNYLNRETLYLEIGVSNPDKNFNHIKSDIKYGIDPGLDFCENPVDFKMTSDLFFHKLDNNELLDKKIKFDVIFIDGLHLAEQVDKDIANSLKHIKNDGFIVVHDCNPPTEWHAREEYSYDKSPWNGTTWKAFLKYRFNKNLNSCCIDSDWGVGIISKSQEIGKSIESQELISEFRVFDNNRRVLLNLIQFIELKQLLNINI